MEEVGTVPKREAMGTVREGYSSDGNAWNYFYHDQSPSRAYRWGEDGLARISDEKQRLCFALALWNGKDRFSRTPCLGRASAVDPAKSGTKAAAHYVLQVPPGGSETIQLRLQAKANGVASFDSAFTARVTEADEG